MMLSRRIPALLAATALSACAGSAGPGFFNPSADDIVWPAPPDPARIRYVGQVASERDIGKKQGFLDGLKQSLLGTGAEALITKRPFDVYVDGRGRIYVSGGTVGAVLMLEPEQKEATVIMPEGLGALTKPMGLAGDAQDLLYVADASQARVVVLDPFMGFVRHYGGPDVLLNPVDVAVAPDGSKIYVVDSQLHQVVIFDREGELLRRVGKDLGVLDEKKDRMANRAHTGVESDPVAAHASEPSDMVENRGVGPAEFRWPAFVDVALDGTVYVSDGMNFRIQALDPDGNYLREIGRQGDVPGAFARPKGVSVDSEGHVYVVDAAFSNIQIFDSEGRLLLTFAEFGGSAGQLWMPSGIAIDSSDRIFVADRYNDRVQVFEYIPDPGSTVVADPAEEVLTSDMSSQPAVRQGE